MDSITTKPYVYIAGPFFNPRQVEIIESTKALLDVHGVRYFSPKDECLFDPKSTTPEQVLELNVKALLKTDLALCVTDGKDPGTLFEAGWCYANSIPLIYLWLDGQPGQKFNLVLAASGSVVRNFIQLDMAIKEIINKGVFDRKNWSDLEMSYE
jgi:nucleoside 2-deoxyribosyltransferase